jgi:Xaa-Pro dipeptidase
LDGAVVRRPENVFYLTGVATGGARPLFAVVGPQREVVVAPVRAGPASSEFARCDYDIPGATIDRVVDVEHECLPALEKAVDIAHVRGGRVGVELEATSALHLQALASLATAIPLAGEIESLRRRKDPDELDLIRAAIRCNEAGLRAAQAIIAPGVSEFEVFLAVSVALQSAAGVAADLSGNTFAFLSGARAAGSAGPASDRRLERGDLMIVDVNPVIRHYRGDVTRTFCVGRPAPAHTAMHDALARALERAMRAGRPGATGQQVYDVLRQTLVESGYGGWLAGHMGHALGLQHLERPFIIPGETMPLEEHMVIALEPGMYVSGELGMRLEDNYVVTASGLEPLSHLPRELYACGPTT